MTPATKPQPEVLSDRILGALCRYWREHCCSPTVRELAAMVKLPPKTVWNRLQALCRAGRVEHDNGRRGGWRPAGLRVIIEAA